MRRMVQVQDEEGEYAEFSGPLGVRAFYPLRPRIQLANLEAQGFVALSVDC